MTEEAPVRTTPKVKPYPSREIKFVWMEIAASKTSATELPLVIHLFPLLL
jgi:hypothetical protein